MSNWEWWGLWPTGKPVPCVKRHSPPPPSSWGSAGPGWLNEKDDDQCSVCPAEVVWNPLPLKFGLNVESGDGGYA